MESRDPLSSDRTGHYRGIVPAQYWTQVEFSLLGHTTHASEELREVCTALRMTDYFFRETTSGGTGRRMGTMAPREGSLAAFARDSTSCWMYFTKS